MLCNVARACSINFLSRLCGRFSWLALAHIHAILHIRRRSKQTDTVPLAWDLHTQVANLCRQLLVLVLFKPRRPDSAIVASESVTGLGSRAVDVVP